MSYRLWVNDDRTVLVRLWDEEADGLCEVATREDPAYSWGAPVRMDEEHHEPLLAARLHRRA